MSFDKGIEGGDSRDFVSNVDEVVKNSETLGFRHFCSHGFGGRSCVLKCCFEREGERRLRKSDTFSQLLTRWVPLYQLRIGKLGALIWKQWFYLPKL